MIKQLEMMKEQLMSCVQGEIGNLREADAKELGEAVDMIKDLSEAIYYCTITEAMQEKEKEGKRETVYYTERIMPPPMMEPRYDYYRDMDKDYGRMYYPYPMDYANGGGRGGSGGNSGGSSGSGGNSGSQGGGSGRGGSSGRGSQGGGNSGSRNYSEYEFPMERIEMRDLREGRSPMTRKMYMESKEMNHDKSKKIKELEEYMKELGQDMTEMIHDASPEEKQLMQRKLTELSTKIGQLNV